MSQHHGRTPHTSVYKTQEHKPRFCVQHSLSKIRTPVSEEILCYIHPETKIGENTLHGKKSNLPTISPRIFSIKCIIMHHEILIDLAGQSSPSQQCIFGLMAKEVNRIITMTNEQSKREIAKNSSGVATPSETHTFHLKKIHPIPR